jgi:HAE1 family hydrophobic/amphiphilic exporter-1
MAPGHDDARMAGIDRGVIAYARLSDHPRGLPRSVTAALPGASAETMASWVATPLERQFSTIAGLDNMSSTSSQGSTQITLQFNLSRNLDGAALDVQSAISAAGRQLPPNMPAPPSYGKVNPADQPVLYLTLNSKVLPLPELDEYGEVMMAQRISAASGVAQVQVYGAQKFAVRVQLDPRELASRGIGVDEVATAVQNANVNLPTGTLYGPLTAFTVQANGQILDAAGYRPVIVAYRNGSAVRVDDVGDVINGVENDKAAAWYNDERSISLAIFKQPGTNTVAVAEAVRKLLPFQSSSRRPPRPCVTTVRPGSAIGQRRPLHASPDPRSGRARDLPLPAQAVATVIPAPRCVLDRGHLRRHVRPGYSVDNLAHGPDLSVGFVVDDAIVMLRTSSPHRAGEAPSGAQGQRRSASRSRR